MTRRRTRALVGGTAAALATGLGLTAPAASADTFTVENEAELRQAVADANANPGLDTIVLGTSITLSGSGVDGDGPEAGDLDVTDDLDVDGQGETIDAAGTDRVFDVSEDAGLALRDLRLRRGAPADGTNGGAVRSAGTLEVTDVVMSDNVVTGGTASGGAVFNDDGVLTVTDSRLRRNTATRAGGAIEANLGETTVRRSALTGNSTGDGPGNGGALHLTGTGDVDVADSHVAGNEASSEGGGLWNSATGDMRVRRTTFVDNVARGDDADNGGGGLFNDGGSMVVNRVTFDSNSATGASGSGGALLNNLGTVQVKNSVARGNLAQRAGGAIEVVEGTTSLTGTDLHANIAGAAPGNGGGLHLTGPGTVVIEGGTMKENQAAAEGGGIWNSSSGDMSVTGVELEDNIARGDAADNGGGAAFNDGGTLELDGVVARGNRATGAAGSGGGVFNNAGEVSITDSLLAQGRATRAGGGIEALEGTTVLREVGLLANRAGPNPGNGGALHLTGEGLVDYRGGTVHKNRATSEGGGLWNSSTGTMDVRRVSIKRNLARGDAADNGGGGLFNDGGDLQVRRADIARNRATGEAGSGGGILNDGGDLLVRRTDLWRNVSQRAGGGIETDAGSVELVRVDLERNVTGSNPGNGGGFHTTGDGIVDYTGGSVMFNVAAAEGGGLWNSATGIMTVEDVRVRRNRADTRRNTYNDGGTFTFNGRPVPVG